MLSFIRVALVMVSLYNNRTVTENWFYYMFSPKLTIKTYLEHIAQSTIWKYGNITQSLLGQVLVEIQSMVGDTWFYSNLLGGEDSMISSSRLSGATH